MTTTTPRPSGSSRPARSKLDPDELAALEEQRDFLLRSIEDLDAEHDAGDIDEADYTQLKDDYTARAAEVLRAIDEQRQAYAEAKRPARRGRLLVSGAAVVIVALVAGWLVARSSGQRQAGQSVSGQAVPTQPQMGQGVDACITKFRSEAPVEGLKCLDAILKQRPSDAVARTFRGWLLYQAIQGTGQADLEAQAKADITAGSQAAPAFPIPHFFLAYIANAEGDTATAKAQLDEFDKMGGSAQGMDAAVQQLRDEIDGTAATTAPGAAPTSAPAAAPTSAP